MHNFIMRCDLNMMNTYIKFFIVKVTLPLTLKILPLAWNTHIPSVLAMFFTVISFMYNDMAEFLQY